MAKTETKTAERGERIDPTMTLLIVGQLAAEASKYGVTPEGRELDFALQAIRLSRAVTKCLEMIDADPELVLEPKIGVALDRLRANVKAETEAIKAEALKPAEEPKAADTKPTDGKLADSKPTDGK